MRFPQGQLPLEVWGDEVVLRADQRGLLKTRSGPLYGKTVFRGGDSFSKLEGRGFQTGEHISYTKKGEEKPPQVLNFPGWST